MVVNFLHIPKTAGSSFEVLVKDCPDLVRFWGHRIKQKIPRPSFCFVRNPYDRLVSAYFYLTDDHAKNEPDISYKELLLKYSDFKDFVMNIRKDRLDKAIIHVKPMSHYICNNGKVDIDRIFKIEEPKKIDAYLKEIGIDKSINLLWMNTSRHRKYTDYLDAEVISEINRIYKLDFKNFNYRML